MARNALMPMFEKCAALAFLLFLIGIAFLCFCYGMAQLYEIEQRWICAGNHECLNYLNDGTIESSPTTVSAIDYSVWNPTVIGVIYCILFFILGFGFITLIMVTFIDLCSLSSSSWSLNKRRKRFKCFAKLRSIIPSRYNSTYSSCLWLISLQLKRCIFESLYLLQKGGINILNPSGNIGVSNRTETKENVLIFAVLLGSNCLMTSLLYTFWWIYFKFSSLSFVIIIVFIESIYDVFFSLFPILSNDFQFGFMNFLDDITNFLTTYFPLLYLLYSIQNSMQYILPFISITNKSQKIHTANSLEISFINKNKKPISDIEQDVIQTDDAEYNKKKCTVIVSIIFFLCFGTFIIGGTVTHLKGAEQYCSTDIVEHWSSFYDIGCQIKLYPFFKENPCDCRTLEVNTQTQSFIIYPESTIQFALRQFSNVQFIGIDSDISFDLHFTLDMYISNALQVLNINGLNVYLLDYFDKWKYLQLLSIKMISDITNNGSSIGHLQYLEAINWSGSSSIKFLPHSFCNLKALKYFNCNGCKLYELPSCFGDDLSNLITLELNYNSNIKQFPASFDKLSNTLNALYCYECTDLYLNTHFPSYFLNFTNLSFLELILYETPICNHIEDESNEMQQFLQHKLACFKGCGDGCFPYAITRCGSECNVADCHYGFGYCLEPQCSNYNMSTYPSKMSDIYYNKECYLEYNTSECQYGFGNCINLNSLHNHSADVCYNEPPYLYDKDAECGVQCKTEWLNEDNWCDTSCQNYSNGINGSDCPYPYSSNVCYKCSGYCALYQYVWDSGFMRSSCDWISGCYLVKFGIPSVEAITGNDYLKNRKEDESLENWWYNITNHSVSLMTPLNYHQTLYYIGPYLDVAQYAQCWNLSYSRINQISCDKCFGDSWNADVSLHKVDGTCDQTTISDWNCNV